MNPILFILKMPFTMSNTTNEGKKKKPDQKRDLYIKTKKKKQKKKESPLLGIFRSLCHLKKNNIISKK
tara:strand:- start:1096 stop:1299 length:204 start_codon:yes stop_codon:yes gene_type:complete